MRPTPRTPTGAPFGASLRAVATLVGAVALLALAACARPVPVEDAVAASAVAADTAAADTLSGPSLLEVRNLSNYDVRVTVIGGGGLRRRLGLVISQATTTFPLDESLQGHHVRIVAEPVGFGRAVLTDPFLLRPGQLVVLGLEKLMRSHTLAVHFM